MLLSSFALLAAPNALAQEVPGPDPSADDGAAVRAEAADGAGDDDAAARRPGGGPHHGRPEGGDKGGPPRDDGDDDKKPGSRPWMHLRPVALAQVWVTAWDMDQDPVADATGYGDPEDDVGFKLERLRLGFSGEEDHIEWAVVVGLTAPYDGFDDQDGSLEVVDAHVGYRTKSFGAEIGRGELPFSRDVMIASGEQTFTERGMLGEHIAPGRNIGATVWGAGWGLKGTAGVFNSGGDLFGDDNLGKTFVGRVEYGTGPADLYETWGGPKKLSLGVGVGGFLTDDVSTSTKAVGADAILRVAGLTVLVDAALADVSPTNTDLDVPGVWAETTRRALTAQVGYGLGPLEPAVKASFYDDSAVGGYTNVLMGVVWHTAMNQRDRDRVRLGAGYELRLEEGAIPNDTVRLWAQVRP